MASENGSRPKVNFQQPVTDFNENKLFLLEEVCSIALNSRESEKGQQGPLSLEVVISRTLFAERIFKADGPISVSPEEMVLLKALIVKTQPPVAAGLAIRALDPEAVK